MKRCLVMKYAETLSERDVKVYRDHAAYLDATYGDSLERLRETLDETDDMIDCLILHYQMELLEERLT